MARIKIETPADFSFSTTIPVRITDLNYGGHVGNDTILTLMHEARMQFLKHYGYSELDFAGIGLIMNDAGIEFKSELFYGDQIIASVVAGDFSKVSFDIYYRFEKQDGEGKKLIALGKTGMICYNYQLKKLGTVPAEAKDKLNG
ncbi:MAG: acyl-CoA thioesterase [Chitinophagaceae bacterium]|nr:MAG: acyl-CoA thioesterase [Chitinophagaceae bacterium]